MRELSLEEVDAITGGYGRSSVSSDQSTGVQTRTAFALNPKPQTLLRQTAPLFEAEHFDQVEQVRAAHLVAPTVRAKPTPIFNNPLASTDPKIYKVIFMDDSGAKQARDVTQTEYDMLAGELRRRGMAFEATVIA